MSIVGSNNIKSVGHLPYLIFTLGRIGLDIFCIYLMGDICFYPNTILFFNII
jgi:hypothetical protein